MQAQESRDNHLDDSSMTKAQLFRHYEMIQTQEVQNRITEDIRIERINKEGKDIGTNNILICLKNHFIFYNLSQPEMENVANKMYFCRVATNQRIYKREDMGTCFFIVVTGRLELFSDVKNIKKVLKAGDGFGELALLYHTERNSQVVAIEDSTLWVIDRFTFRAAVEEMIMREYTENKKCLESVRFFSNLTPDQKDIIASSLIRQKFYKNQIIIQEGDPGSTFFYIKDGNASVYKASNFHRKLTKGDSFGQQSLYYNTMRQYTIKADEDMTCLVLGRDSLNRIMGQNIYEITFKNFIRWSFEKNNTLNQLSKQKQEKIIEQMKISSFKAQESIFKRSVTGFQKLVVVIEGSLKKLKSGVIVATKGQCFGEQYLKEQNKQKVLDDEIVMQTYGVIAQISDSAFQIALGSLNLKQLIMSNREEKKLFQILDLKNQLRINFQRYSYDDFKIIGLFQVRTQFGPIYLISNNNDQQYILKIISKKKLQQYEVESFAIDESKVLNKVSFPFIINVLKSFQTPSHLYYIQEYVKGTQFYDVLKSIGLLSTEDSQFYAATIILILEYFQQKSIICRDIKPQNFMVDHQGYLKLLNLPTAKQTTKDSHNNFKKTYTIIGTPHYMAPEIVIGKGYTNMVDLWSLGICLYEFLCGVLPFGDDCQNAYQIYEQVMQSQLIFPEFLHDKKAKKLIEQLLNHNPSQRHGGSFQTLKRHQWFQKFVWKGLFERNRGLLAPPVIPQKIEKQMQRMNSRLPQLIKLLEGPNIQNKIQDVWAQFGQFYGG